MLKKLIVLALMAVFTGSPLVYAETLEEATAQCKQYAADENIPADELDEYLENCVKELTE